METTIIETTLWDLLRDPMLGLHFPRFALFLSISIILEIYCDIKKTRLACSLPTVTLQIYTVIGGLVSVYFTTSTYFNIGERVTIPFYFYFFTIFIIGILTAIFFKGIISLFKEKMIKNCVIRIIIYIITIYFTITVIVTPYKVNKILQKREIEMGKRTNE